MAANRVKTYHLAIKLKKFTAKESKFAKYGYIETKSRNRHVVYVNTDHKLMVTIGTLYHEFSHWMFSTIFKDNELIAEDTEHEFCENMDLAAQDHFKSLINEDTDE